MVRLKVEPLDAAERDLRALFESASVGIARVGLDATFGYVNPTMTEIFGYSVEELNALTFRDLTHPDDLAKSENWLKQFVQSEISRVDGEKKYRHKNGRVIDVYVRITPVRNAQGEVIHFISIYEDITERKRSEELLRRQKHILELVARTRPLKETLTEIIRLIEEQNPGCSSTIYLIEDGKRLRLGAAPSFPQSFVDAVNGAAIGPEAGSCGVAAYTGKRCVSTNVDLDPCWGPYREWFKSYGFRAAWSTPVLSGDGRVIGTVSMCWREPREPTTRDFELADLAVGLMGIAIDRAQAEQVILTQQASLVSSSKMAALGEMGGALAHEINNPLTIIHGNAVLLGKLIEKNALDESEVLSAASRIKETALRISEIVKGLRTFARDGKHDPKKPALVRELIDDALVLCRERFKNNGISLEVEAGDPSWTVECRAVELVQVLVNLLSNAFDAVQGAPAPRHVRLSASRPSPESIVLAVEDSGPGVPVELRDKIMQPFFTTKPPGQGTGLGLSIASGIVLGHGGRLYLDPKNASTKFLVEIPIAA